MVVKIKLYCCLLITTKPELVGLLKKLKKPLITKIIAISLAKIHSFPSAHTKSTFPKNRKIINGIQNKNKSKQEFAL